jgi:hypothetical protein
MKYVSLAVAVVLLPLILSCRSTLVPNVETADVIGRVELFGRTGWLPSNKGVTVTVENTNFSAVTDDSGMFEFKGIPEGTYNIHYSKPGFGDVIWYSKSIQGGGNVPVYWTEDVSDYNSGSVRLILRPDFVTTLQFASMFDTAAEGISTGDKVIKVMGSYAGGTPNLIAVFLSHHSNVSCVPGTYEDYVIPYYWSGQVPEVKFDSNSRSFEALIDLNRQQLWYDFHSGDSVYIACYATPLGSPGLFSNMPSGYGDYYDPIHKINVLTSIDQTPSPVIGLKIP